jgi:hypothetical protein
MKDEAVDAGKREDEEFYRPTWSPKTYSTEELERRKVLTDSIRENLRVINADAIDLDALERRLVGLVTAMRILREYEAEHL